MEQSGMLEKGAPTDTRFVRIKHFINQFINANSEAQNITDCTAKLAAVMDEFQVRIIEGSIVTSNGAGVVHNYYVHSNHTK
jgi:hypothetical protein